MTDNAVVEMRAERFFASDIVHGEGPVWLDGQLAVLDMLRGRVVLVDPAGRLVAIRSLETPVVALVGGRQHGGLAVVLEHEIRLLDGGWNVQSTHRVLDDPRVRFNEGTVAPDGSLLCGSMAYDQAEPLGAVYRFDGERALVARDQVTIANGVQFTASGSGRFIDSARYEVETVEWREGSMTTTGVLAAFDPDEGMPDGLALDTVDGTWVALFGGGCVVRLDPAGRITHRITLPTPDATSCAFIGHRRDRLVITTSALRTGDTDRDAGAVFVVDAPYPGAEMPLCAF